jgi:hypothetical protein
MPQSRHVRIDHLRPNNWYINRAKLNQVRHAWQQGTQGQLPPILVTQIDGELSLIDGHSRALAALEHGEPHILASFEPLEAIEGATSLYVHIHRTGPELGILSVRDLAERIVTPDEHARLWVGYCERWLAGNGYA